MDTHFVMEIAKTALMAASAVAVPVGLEIARRTWREFKESNKFKEQSWITRKIEEIVVASVASTYAKQVRPMKLNSPTGQLTAGQKTQVENTAISMIKEAANQAGIGDQLQNDDILRGKVVNAVTEAGPPIGPKLKPAIKSSPSTKGA